MKVQDRISQTWSNIDVRKFGPYHENLAAALAEKIWNDPQFKAELLKDPKRVLKEEISLEISESRQFNIVDKKPDEFYFVLPEIPPEEELWYRYEQMAGWWMFAHSMWWWMTRHFGDKASPFLTVLNVQIIGRTWNDMSWRKSLIDNPRETLEAETGTKFPPSLKVYSLVDTSKIVNLVIPTQPKDEDLETNSKYLGGMFTTAHTWWQWLVYPKLLKSIDPSVVSGMVD